MNSVHPGHRPERYGKRRHLIFTFHERTFECVCDGFEVFRTQGLIETIVPRMMKLLEWSGDEPSHQGLVSAGWPAELTGCNRL